MAAGGRALPPLLIWTRHQTNAPIEAKNLSYKTLLSREILHIEEGGNI